MKMATTKGCAIKVDETPAWGDFETRCNRVSHDENEICKTHKMKVTLTRGSKLVACCKFDKTRSNGRCTVIYKFVFK